FSARYLNDTTVRLERRRNNDEFPAWVQGIDFSGLNQQIAAAGGDPPNLVVPGDGYTLAPGATLTVTFQVTVDDPLAPAISQIDNTATLNTDQQGPFMASATDDVVRLGVTVEPNNAGFTVAGGSVTYTHFVTNVGEAPDSYALTLISELGYAVELLDPDTGAVIAVDSNGDGVWDGGQLVNTGTLAVGESVEYRLRVNVPLGTPLGTEETTALIATSDRSAGTFAFATDETTVVDSIDFGPVALDPDHSGVVASGGSIAYTHTVTNNTGAPDTFDLTAFPTLPGWTATIYNDSNGDGVYTPGVDVAIANTLQLSDGQLQTIFVVVEAPPGAPAGDTDVVHLTAISRNDPALFDAATDTTTVVPATTHDLSGGGTRLVTPSSTAVFPGTLKNLSTAADRFDFTVTASLFFGLDGLNHPTQLWIDTNADGVPDTQIAEDADGDGDWDTIAPGFDVDGDLNPDVAVAGGSGLAYELRRPVDPAQLAYRDPVTLAAVSQATGERDSVTATNLLPAATHALLAGFEVYAAGGEVVVEWTTASEVGTVGFYLVRTDAAGRQERLPRQRLLPSLLHAPQGGTYRFVDAGARPDALYGYRLVEVDVRGAERRFGPFEAVADRRRGEAPSKLLATGYVKQAHTSLLAPPADPAVPPKASAPPSGWVRLPVDAAGMAFVAAADLAAGWGETEATVAAWIQSGQVRVALNPFPLPLPAPCAANPGGIFRDGFESGDTCAWSALVDPRYVTTPIAWLGAAGGAGLYFYGEAIDSPFTTDNVYWISRGAGLLMGSRDGGAPAPAAGGSFPERLHFEQEAFPLTSVISNPDSDFWFWDFFLAGNAAHGSKSFTVTTPAPAAGTGATLTVRLHGQTDDPDVTPDHHVEVRWNGTLVGEARWDGGTAHRVDLAVPAGLVAGGANTVEITSRLAAGVVGDVLYLESLDVAYARRYRAAGDRLEAGATAAVVTVEGFSASDVTVFDVTDPRRPNVVVNATLDEVGGEHRVSFARNTAASRYLALRLDALPAAALEVDLASGLRSAGNRGAYLVLAGAGLETAAESLADYRRSLGLEAMTVRLQDVYDEFNAGVASPLAIRDFLAHAARRWQLRPRWVVLAGDGSFDYKDLLGAGDNLVPALMAATADGLFPSDHRFADGGKGVPSVFIGRIPARTNAELAAYVAKLQAYESAGGAWRGEAVWVADDADEGGEFLADTETLVPLVPLAAERVYVDDVGAAGARQELLAAIRSGALLVSYLGHGGPDRLADEGLLLTGDVASLDNGERLPVLTALTCSVGRFDFPGFATLSETLVRSAGGGVIAVLSPSGLSFNAEARQLGEAFLGRALTPSKTIGEAVAGALAEYAASPGADRDLPYLFILLGDPAIRLDP
ncbi:MAG TPA: C25 family cysteine peptidase, partial [Thermoanaerobaculia bacterium]